MTNFAGGPPIKNGFGISFDDDDDDDELLLLLLLLLLLFCFDGDPVAEPAVKETAEAFRSLLCPAVVEMTTPLFFFRWLLAAGGVATAVVVAEDTQTGALVDGAAGCAAVLPSMAPLLRKSSL